MTSIEHVETLLNGRGRLPESWILLDTCSSADLISNPSLLKDIHMVDRTMNIRCNAGYTSTNQMGYMGDCPVPVWYNPKGIANILSLDNVSRYYRLTMDTKESPAITLHRGARPAVHFTLSTKGLYRFDLAKLGSTEDVWSFLTTVDGQADKYTHRAYKAAAQARHLQNIIM